MYDYFIFNTIKNASLCMWPKPFNNSSPNYAFDTSQIQIRKINLTVSVQLIDVKPKLVNMSMDAQYSF